MSHTKSPITNYVFNNTKLSIVWLLARVYVGWIWVGSGWEKVKNPAWVGDNAGVAVEGFVKGALEKTSGPHPDVQAWYAWFLDNIVLSNTEIFAFLVAYGELLVGVALILGIFTSLATFFGVFMNMSFLLAGTVSTNPTLLILGILIIAAGENASKFGLDSYVKPYIPWLNKR